MPSWATSTGLAGAEEGHISAVLQAEPLTLGPLPEYLHLHFLSQARSLWPAMQNYY